MATLRKAFDLAKEKGISTRDAIAQVEGNVGTQTTSVTPTPSANPTGATMPIAPTVNTQLDLQNLPPQPLAKAGDAVIGVNGERFVQANNADMTTAPVAPPKVVNQQIDPNIQNAISEPISPEIQAKVDKATPAQVVDFNVSQGREGEIQKNVSDITQGNPTLLKDRNAYNQAFGYETADQGKKALLDSAFQSGQPQMTTSDQMFGSILTKAPVSDEQKATLPYKIAQNRYAKASSYSTMTPSQVSGAMNNGKLIEGSQTYEDLKTINPKIVQDAENLRIVNGQSTNIFTVKPDGTKVNNLENTFAEDYLDNFGTSIRDMFKVYSTEEIQNIIRTPEVKEAENKTFGYEKKIDDLDTLIAKADNDILESQKGTGATGTVVRLLQQSARDKLTEERIGLVKDYTRYANKVNNLITQNTTNFQTQQTQMNARNAALLGRENTLLNAQLGKDQSVFNAKLGLQTKQAEFEQGLAQKLQTMNDPSSAISTLVEEYKKNGIPTETAQSLITKFASSGMDLPTYLESVQSTIRKSAEYQAYQAKQSGTEWQSTNITRYNPSTGANESTPIFYRKKTSGGFEAVDLSGNPIDVSNLGGTGTGPSSPGALPGSFSGDTTSYIASKEGFRDKAYQDSGGVWTIGYGTTKMNGKPVQPGQTITQADAQALLNQDIAKHSNWKNYIDESSLSDSQKTALASFEYNLGPGIWDKGAVNIINMIKSGDLSGAGKEMKKYNTVKGTVVNGLTNRRNEEANLLMNNGNNTNTNYSADKVKSFEAFNGTTFPSDYKTPAQQKQYRDEYNAWRESQGSTAIKTGQDIINLRLSDKATEGEKASIQYASRALNVINDLGAYEDTFSKLPLKDQLYETYAPELLKSDNQKILEARKKDFITAVLRKESGASIASSEFANEEKKYFAQPGDSQAVLVAKQNARNFAIKSLLTGAGQDVNGKSINTLYNPPAIEAKNDGTESITDRLARLRKK